MHGKLLEEEGDFMKTIVGLTLALAALASAAPISARADSRDHGRAWHGDIQRFEAHDLHHWRSGAWRHGRHAGRYGWWWVLGGTWYFYPRPVYPYPDPFLPPGFVVEVSPPPVVVQAPTTPPVLPPQVIAPAPAAPQFWYYCEAAKAYYPYVAACPSGWKTVPATPKGVSP